MLPRIFIASTLIAASCIPATAQTAPDKLMSMVENICIAGRLEEDLLRPMLETTGKVLDMHVRDFPLDLLRQVNPDATSGAGLVGSSEAYIFVFARKPDTEGVSRSCSVASQDIDDGPIKAFVESKFRSRQVTSERQGQSTITLYELDLIGFPAKRYLSVQTMGEPGVAGSMTSVGFFDLP